MTMRKRSEMVKAKSEPKPSAAERTKPLFTDGSLVKCEACGTVIDLKKLTARADGTHECSTCGAPLDIDALPRQPQTEPAREKPKGEETYDHSSSRVDVKMPEQTIMRATMYCGECATTLSEALGKDDKPLTFFPCGHTGAEVVDSPSKAKKVKPAAGSQMMPERDGLRVHVEWGESMFRVADFSSFRVGPISMTFTVQPGTSVSDAVRRARQEMKKLADEEFDQKLEWYREKLGLLKKG
jgi:hypothetical protein